MKNILLAAILSLFALPAAADVCGDMEEELGLLVFREVIMISREYDIDVMQAAELAGLAALDSATMSALPRYISLSLQSKQAAVQDLMIEFVEQGCY